jgi:hypothetical protein
MEDWSEGHCQNYFPPGEISFNLTAELVIPWHHFNWPRPLRFDHTIYDVNPYPAGPENSLMLHCY